MSNEATGFLYPFIESEERDLSSLMGDLAASAQAKTAISVGLRRASLEDSAGVLRRVGRAMADRFRRGGRLFAFGNGGSATDADGAVELFRTPPHGRALAAVSLVEDQAVLTGLANDVGFDLVFSRQLIAHAHPEDIALGISTSGSSVNVLRAFDEASRRGLLTVGLCGGGGGAMAANASVDHCLVVCSDSVHRIQEAQDALLLELWARVREELGEGEPS